MSRASASPSPVSGPASRWAEPQGCSLSAKVPPRDGSWQDPNEKVNFQQGQAGKHNFGIAWYVSKHKVQGWWTCPIAEFPAICVIESCQVRLVR